MLCKANNGEIHDHASSHDFSYNVDSFVVLKVLHKRQNIRALCCEAQFEYTDLICALLIDLSLNVFLLCNLDGVDFL